MTMNDDLPPIFQPAILARLYSIEPVLLGQRLRKVREDKHFTQKGLSIAVGCPEAYLNSIEVGVVRPTIKMLESLADILGYPVGYFLREEA